MPDACHMKIPIKLESSNMPYCILADVFWSDTSDLASKLDWYQLMQVVHILNSFDYFEHKQPTKIKSDDDVLFEKINLSNHFSPKTFLVHVIVLSYLSKGKNTTL